MRADMVGCTARHHFVVACHLSTDGYEKKRNEILSAALMLFGEKGFEGTTMDEIAKEIGFTKAALYQYFTSKEELFSSVLHESQLNMNAKRIKFAGSPLNDPHHSKSYRP